MTRSHKVREKWTRIIREQRGSGLSVAAFCHARSIPASSLFAWKRKLAGADAGVRSGSSAAFVEATVRGVCHEDGGGVAIEMGGGKRVMVSCGFDRHLLLEVLDALESRVHSGGGGGSGGAGTGASS